MYKKTVVSKLANILWFGVIPLLVVGIIALLIPVGKATATGKAIQTTFVDKLGMSLVAELDAGGVVATPIEPSQRNNYPEGTTVTIEFHKNIFGEKIRARRIVK